jgi:heterodisulfide reductase subunit A-like polyferredoxin
MTSSTGERLSLGPIIRDRTASLQLESFLHNSGSLSREGRSVQTGAQADTLNLVSRTNDQVPVGAVMVVGGGIAGMQASLDLADQGFRVYLVESKSAIGGHMAQLDKTFPTNDCAMCTISPKLVETGRHLNIDILVDTEVVKIDGEAGNFNITVKHKPRYIDLEKCVGCNDCADVCPVILPDRFNEGLSERRAAHKLYPQAVPNAFAIEKLGISPCRDACPAGQRAQGYIALIREGRYDDALRVIKEDNPFPGICGRICNHRCEDACNRGLIDEPINIRALKRFVTDKVYAEPRQPIEAVEITQDKRIAIIGAGPCGLTAAQDLIRLGYPVTIFEALPVAGGMLRVGVPEYRLPTEIIEREVADILDLGVELRLNTVVEDLDELFEQGFDAVLIAVGAHEGIRLPIPGADLEGVLINTRFLRDVRLDRYTPDENGQVTNPDGTPFGKRVLILGGGNVAIDCARTAARLGAEVHLACLEPRESMPCHAWEADTAEEEGVTIHADRTFIRVVNNGQGHAIGVECARVAHFEFDHEGRLSVETIPDSEHMLEADTIIFSVGQRAGLAFIPEDAGVGITRQRTIAINPNTMAATRPGVFAAGDSVSGTAFVIEAVASGHQAAESIYRYLKGDELEAPPKPDLPVVKFTRAELLERVAHGEFELKDRVPMPELPLEGRLGNFAEVERGYTDELAQEEAARCLSCALCSECLSCQYICGRDAIDHNMVAWTEQINVGAVILAPGYQIYRAELSQEYGLGRYPNVVTALQLERLLSASGPTQGHVNRPSDDQPARKIAFLQCVGSRDQSHDYCSAVCCMYAAKEAVMIREHDQEAQVHIFMMDMRAFSKGYEGYYKRARQQYDIEYTRCRISSLCEDPETRNLIVRYAQDLNQGGAVIEEEVFDLVVLSVGMEISDSVKRLGQTLGIELDEYGFCHTAIFDPLQTTKPGIFAAGPFREPKDIPETVVDASGAAADAAGLLAPARFSLTRSVEYPPERDTSEEDPRVGVFVCHCGSNIGGFLEVPDVAEYAKGLPCVVHAEDNLYTCSQDSIAHITEQVKELGLNRVVVASCTPITHGPLFQDSIRAAGLNPALFEMANIRNQCSWVHSHDRQAATKKAKELVRMAAARATTLQPIHTTTLPIYKDALVVGGGVAGMTTSLSLADGGYNVHLVEREEALGGNLRHVRYCTDEFKPLDYLQQLIASVEAEPRIHIYTGTRIAQTSGFMGRFTTMLKNGQKEPIEVQHGVTILTTGGQEYRGSEYSYGSNPRIVTGLEFEKLLYALEGEDADPDDRTQALRQLLGDRPPNDIAMVLCVGPAEHYCSRICCTTALKNALTLKRINPQARVTILFKDIRTYGFKERLYTQARQEGVIFLRYDEENRPAVDASGDQLTVEAFDLNLDREVSLTPNLLVLSNPIVPPDGARELATQFKVPIDKDGFLLEAHVKLRPVDFPSDGIFMAGMAHYPKLLDESIVQAKAAAARASRVLSRKELTAGGIVAHVDPEQCVGCLTCVRVCPFEVPRIIADQDGVGGIHGAAFIEPTVCQGCGNCVAECPAKAIHLTHYEDDQIVVKVDALLLGA